MELARGSETARSSLFSRHPVINLNALTPERANVNDENECFTTPENTTATTPHRPRPCPLGSPVQPRSSSSTGSDCSVPRVSTVAVADHHFALISTQRRKHILGLFICMHCLYACLYVCIVYILSG